MNTKHTLDLSESSVHTPAIATPHNVNEWPLSSVHEGIIAQAVHTTGADQSPDLIAHFVKRRHPKMTDRVCAAIAKEVYNRVAARSLKWAKESLMRDCRALARDQGVDAAKTIVMRLSQVMPAQEAIDTTNEIVAELAADEAEVVAAAEEITLADIANDATVKCCITRHARLLGEDVITTLERLLESGVSRELAEQQAIDLHEREESIVAEARLREATRRKLNEMTAIDGVDARTAALTLSDKGWPYVEQITGGTDASSMRVYLADNGHAFERINAMSDESVIRLARDTATRKATAARESLRGTGRGNFEPAFPHLPRGR